LQEGMAEGEKAMAEAKALIDNPLVEPESAPQIAAEPALETTTAVITAEAAPAAEPAPSASEPAVPAADEKPAKAVAVG